MTWDPGGLGSSPATITPCGTLSTSCPSLSFYLPDCKLRAGPESISSFSKTFYENQLQVFYCYFKQHSYWTSLNLINNRTPFSSSQIKFLVHRIALLSLVILGSTTWHLYSYLAFSFHSKDTKMGEKGHFQQWARIFRDVFSNTLSGFPLSKQYYDPPIPTPSVHARRKASQWPMNLIIRVFLT